MNAASRTIAILLDPDSEWSKIETEPSDPLDLLVRYVVPLAPIPALFGFVGACFVGVIVPGLGLVRAPLLHGLFGAIFGYLASFVAMALLAAMIRLCAPQFGKRIGFTTAFKLAVYSYTPAWLAGVFLLLPGLRFLTLSGFYGGYILLVGLRRSAKLPMSKAQAFAALIVACAFVLVLLLGSLQHALFPGSVAL